MNIYSSSSDSSSTSSKFSVVVYSHSNVVEVILVLVLGVLLETGRHLLVFIDNCELLHLARRQVSLQAGFNLFKNLVSRELFSILENFHFSISISDHFDFTFHSSKKSESICFSLCTSGKRVKAFFFSLCTSRKRVKAFLFHFSLLELQKPTLAGPWVEHQLFIKKMCKYYQSVMQLH